jgi:Flp pilus assembly protein TadD
MWRYLLGALFLGGLSGTAHAGVYIPGEPADFVPSDGKIVALSFDRFRLKMADLTGAAAALDPRYKTSELGKLIVAKAKELDQRKARLTADELTALGAFDYRLAKWDAALDVLLQATRMDRSNFRATSDLATLEFAQGQYQEAWRYLSDAKSLQPRELTGMSRDEMAWCFKVDGILRTLARARAREKQSAIPVNQLPPDDLFGVEFVGESGSYESGKLAQVQKSKLPDDAIAIVQQLLLWTPSDARLYWLLAELYNASGETSNALTIMNDCMDARRYQPDLLREHRRVIQEAVDRQQQEDARRREEQAQKQKQSDEEQAHSKERTKKIMIGVGVIFGAIVLLLLYWQVGIVLRRVSKK